MRLDAPGAPAYRYAYLPQPAAPFYAGSCRPKPDFELQALLDSNAAELVGVAAEYGLMELRKISEQSCIRTLAVDNVKGFLQLAHLHEFS